MTEEELQDKIKVIVKEHAGDDEAQHSLEDDLHLEVIEAFCPVWVQAKIQRLSNADFNRWCA